MAKRKQYTLDEAVESIKDLTSTEIAKKLSKAKVYGRPGTVTNCPLAEYLHRTFGGAYIVGPNYIVKRCKGKIQKIPAPKGASKFITEFDLSRYPELILPPPRILRKAKIPTTRNGYKRGTRRTLPKKIGALHNMPKVVGRW